MPKLDFLRKEHPRFIYRNFNIKWGGGYLKIIYDFFIEPNITFHPQIVIKNVNRGQVKIIGESALRNLVFHCGLAEIPSYWKATCSPEIMIRAGYLDKEQINWWRDLFIKGLGQFFYENKIDFWKPGFLKIKAPERKHSNILQNVRMFSFYRSDLTLRDRYLVPLAGGRDSIVTVELLKKQKKGFAAFSVNPTREAKAVMRMAGTRNPIIVERKIDPKLFELNQKGYLNGHTPFTSVLSFLAVLCAVLFNYRHIAFSNEKSADEGNLKWHGMIINHQYSKSSEFEKKFSAYTKKYLAKNLHYFSLLRKYSDLEISKIFSKYPQYFPVFSSCNRGIKLHKRWCGECAKCLFVYMTLYPFLDKKDMFKIFGQDLFQKRKLLATMKALINPKIPKPFECVGTKRESERALLLSLHKAKKIGDIPLLLRKI